MIIMKINFIGIRTICSREAQRTLRTSIQSLAAPWTSAFLYILIFGQIIGSRVSFVDGKFSYLEFVFPGILTLNLINSSFSQASFSIFYQRFASHIQEMLVSPLSNTDIITGYIFGSLFRSVTITIGIYAIAIAFKIASISHFWQFLFYAIAIAVLFSLLGIVSGLWADTWEQVSMFEIFIITPLTFLGGMFTSLSMISPKFQPIIKFNPFFYFIDGVRYSMIGIQESNPTTRFILVVGLLVSAMIWVAVLFKRGYKLKT